MQSLRRDGETAGGDPPIHFVHGWCCDHTYFAPQFERYAERGHRVVAADEAQPRSDMSRFHEMFPDILYGKTVGSGHFCQLEVPEQINAMIDRFLALMLPR
jgi:pimeloyl-ACP methyl ester carboxylesterase